MTHFEENKGAWLLFGALIVACYAWYGTHEKFQRVCDLAESANEISDRTGIGTNPHPSPETIKADIATLQHLKTEDSLQGDLYRWQSKEGAQIEEICNPPDDGGADE